MREARPVSVDRPERRQSLGDGLSPQPGRHLVEGAGVAAELGHDRGGEAGREPVVAFPPELAVLVNQPASGDDPLGVHGPEVNVETFAPAPRR